jgi:ubiquitin C-terminal hydrolase
MLMYRALSSIWFLRSFTWGPTISLEDCFSAYFTAADLKGDNMYSCEKCKKLSDGVKYSKLLFLPEVSNMIAVFSSFHFDGTFFEISFQDIICAFETIPSRLHVF